MVDNNVVEEGGGDIDLGTSISVCVSWWYTEGDNDLAYLWIGEYDPLITWAYFKYKLCESWCGECKYFFVYIIYIYIYWKNKKGGDYYFQIILILLNPL